MKKDVCNYLLHMTVLLFGIAVNTLARLQAIYFINESINWLITKYHFCQSYQEQSFNELKNL